MHIYTHSLYKTVINVQDRLIRSVSFIPLRAAIGPDTFFPSNRASFRPRNCPDERHANHLRKARARIRAARSLFINNRDRATSNDRDRNDGEGKSKAPNT